MGDEGESGAVKEQGSSTSRRSTSCPKKNRWDEEEKGLRKKGRKAWSFNPERPGHTERLKPRLVGRGLQGGKKWDRKRKNRLSRCKVF